VTVATDPPTKRLRVRETPGTGAAVLGMLAPGERREVLERADGWVRVADGWLMERYVK
jgi:hypothetical protein